MTIEDWRVEIDKIDAELLRLLNARAEIAVRVGESKRVAGLSVCDRGREREVVERARRANRGPRSPLPSTPPGRRRGSP